MGRGKGGSEGSPAADRLRMGGARLVGAGPQPATVVSMRVRDLDNWARPAASWVILVGWGVRETSIRRGDLGLGPGMERKHVVCQGGSRVSLLGVRVDRWTVYTDVLWSTSRVGRWTVYTNVIWTTPRVPSFVVPRVVCRPPAFSQASSGCGEHAS